MTLEKLLQRIKTEDRNASLHYEVAEALHKAGRHEETRYHLRKGIEIDLSAMPLVQVFNERLMGDKVLTFIVPKPGCYSKKMLFDGLSWYSYILFELLEYLFKKKCTNIILSLNNVEMLADFGQAAVLLAQKNARTLKGDVKCINGNSILLAMSKDANQLEYPQIYPSMIDVIESF